MGLENRLKSVLEAIQYYCKPNFDGWAQDQTVKSLDDVISLNREQLLELISIRGLGIKLKVEGQCTSGPLDSKWQYACLGNSLLTELKDILLKLKLESEKTPQIDPNPQAPPVPPDTLSVQQEKTVQQCFQLTITFGVLPYLIPNLGIPLCKRSTFSHLVTSGETEEIKYERLVFMARSILGWLQTSPHLNPLLISSHLTDLLAVLFQLAFAPVKKPDNSKVPQTSNFQMTSAFHARIQSEQTYFRQKLDQLLDNVYPALAIESLLWLQGPSPNAAKVLRDAPPSAPLWLRLRCGSYVTKFLLKPNGLLTIIQAVIGTGPCTGVGSKSDALARLIATPPKGIAIITYFEQILPQVLTLPKDYVKLAGEILRLIAEKQPQTLAKYWDDLLISLRQLSEGDPLPGETQLTSTVELIHHYLVYGSDPSSQLLQFLRPYSPVLFSMYAFTLTSILHLKTILQEILLKWLNFDSDPLQALRDLNLEENPTKIYPHPDLSFRLGSDLGIIPELNADNSLDDDAKSDTLIRLIRLLNQPNLTCEFFLSLLKELTNIVRTPEPKVTTNRDKSTVLLDLEQKVTVYTEQLGRQLVFVRLISNLASEQSLQNAITENAETALNFCRLTLERGCVKPEKSDHSLPAETLCLTMAVIGILAANGLSWDVLNGLEPILGALAENHEDQNVRYGAKDLRIAIVTRGTGMEVPIVPTSAKEHFTLFQEMWNELHDPLIPVQGHALLQLGKLIKIRDPETLKHKEQCFDKLNECLRHEDSYIYLMAVDALSLLADYQPDTVLNILLSQFEEEEFSQRSTEIKMTIGEVLVRVTRLLGPMTPKYKAELLNVFLRGCRDNDAFVRASSLSNLGEVCGLLSFSLGSILYEIFECVSSCAKFDPAIEVRRAAWMVVHLMLKGLNQDALTVLQPVLRDLHRALREVLKTEPDQAIQAHVSLALDYLDAIVLQFLNPPVQSSKTIYLTRPLP